MDSQTTSRRELVRGLDLSATTALVVGTIIGTGVFLKTARMAQAVGTPWLVLLAWAAAGLLSLAGALSYAELGAMLPNAGGEYVYLRAAYGDMPAFFFGWMRLVIGSSGSIASFGAAFATFLSALIPMNSAGRKSTGVAVILLFSAINCLRVTIGGRVQTILTLAKVLAIASIAVGVFFFAPTASWEHLRAPSGVPAWCGFPAFGAAMLAALWAFDGWNNMPMAAGEVRDPGRNVPRALILGMAVVLLVYGLLNLAYCVALPMGEIANANSPLHDTALPVASKAAQTFMPRFGAQWVAIATLLSTIGALNGSILTGARIPYAMARDGLFFASFARLGQRSAVPVVSIILQGLWSALLVVMAEFDQLTDCVIFASMIFYAITTAAVFVLRKKMPDAQRPYKTLGYPVVPILFIAVAIWLLINTLSTNPLESAAGLGLIALGWPVYLWQRRSAGR
ncbi:MAG TPA: amino acid permease [Verrucomicrobiae bacterium]|nr:amino acid permease [Verrucomicrobiae bacterium]